MSERDIVERLTAEAARFGQMHRNRARPWVSDAGEVEITMLETATAIEALHAENARMQGEHAALLADRDGLQSLVDRMHKQDILAIQAWQRANPCNDLVWPAQSRLTAWCMGEAARAIAERDTARAENAWLRMLLGDTANQFEFYAAQHAVKGTPEAEAKASVNRAWVRKLREARVANDLTADALVEAVAYVWCKRNGTMACPEGMCDACEWQARVSLRAVVEWAQTAPLALRAGAETLETSRLPLSAMEGAPILRALADVVERGDE